MLNLYNKYGLLCLFVCVFLLTFFFLKRRDPIKICKEDFNELIKPGVLGKVNRKYIDKHNHSYPIIEIKNYNGTIERFNLTLERSGLFDSLEEGYLFRKFNGDSVVYYGTKSFDKAIEMRYDCQNWQ